MYRLSATLDAFAPFLPPALVPAAALERARATSGRLPAPLTDRLCLECRLRGDDPRTDLVVGVERAGAAILAGGDAALPLHPSFAEREPWVRLREFCREWLAPGSPLHRAVERLWLEFDIPATADGDADAAPLPGVFIDLATPAAGASPEISRALGALLGRGLPAAVGNGLERCLAALPAGAAVPYAGVLIPRGTDLVRLCVSGLDEVSLPGYLWAVGWPGSHVALRGLLARLRAPGGQEAAPTLSLLHLDVGAAGALPKIGLELAFARPDQLRGRLREEPFLALLVEEGWCAPEKRDALLAWPGAAVTRLPHELWPSLALRQVAHVKLALAGDGVAEAKAYLSLRHAPRLRRPG